MKFRFPLFAKILVWFFLNLALLSAVLYGYIRIQFHVGLDSLFSEQAGSRMENISNLLEAELRETPRANWDAVLERFAAAYDGVDFHLVRPNGTRVAGTPVELPAQVRDRFAIVRNKIAPPSPPAPAPEAVARIKRQRKLDKEARMEAMRRVHLKFMVRTENPVRYWVCVKVQPGKRGVMPVENIWLLASSESLSGGGLFFDVGPWATVGLAALALSILFWLPLVGGITRSVSKMTGATEQIADGNFEARVNDSRQDELGRLGQAINAMAGRLAGFVTGQKRFLGDVAHELCSPLARIEVALSILETRADTALQPRIADVREEAREMASLVNELLAFSKAGLRGREIRLEPVALAELVRRIATREGGEGGSVEVEIDEALRAQAEPELLGRAMANLIRNAFRYAGDAGPICVRALAREGAVQLTVTDAGPGVPEEALTQLFDPFFRLDASRSRDTGGFGLGLAIVKTCVQACNGSVIARNVVPSGLQVEITLNPA